MNAPHHKSGRRVWIVGLTAFFAVGAIVLVAAWLAKPARINWDLRTLPNIQHLDLPSGDEPFTIKHVQLSADLPGGLEIDEKAQSIRIERSAGQLRSIEIVLGPMSKESAFRLTEKTIERLRVMRQGSMDGTFEKLRSWNESKDQRHEWPRVIVGKTGLASDGELALVLNYSFREELPWLVELHMTWEGHDGR